MHAAAVLGRVVEFPVGKEQRRFRVVFEAAGVLPLDNLPELPPRVADDELVAVRGLIRCRAPGRRVPVVHAAHLGCDWIGSDREAAEFLSPARTAQHRDQGEYRLGQDSDNRNAPVRPVRALHDSSSGLHGF